MIRRKWQTRFVIAGQPTHPKKFRRRCQAFDDFSGLSTHLLHLHAGMTIELVHKGRIIKSVTA